MRIHRNSLRQIGCVGVCASLIGLVLILVAQSGTNAGASLTCSGSLSSSAVGMAPTTDGYGYWIADSQGDISSCGDAPITSGISGTFQGSIVGIASNPISNGFWLVSSKGQVFDFLNAGNYGDASSIILAKGIVSISSTPDGNGYWLLGGDGGVFSYGDAQFYGSTGAIHLNKPAVGMAPTPDGKGYWFVASDGGIFSFGDAQFYGSMGGQALAKPVNGMTVSLDGKGYRLVASDGGIFSFGDAQFYGSASNTTVNPIVGMASSNDSQGYWIISSSGAVFSFGDAPGSTTSSSTTSSPTPGPKAPLTGLVDMESESFYSAGVSAPTTDPSTLDSVAPAFGGLVVVETWSQLEPTNGQEVWTDLDNSLAAVTVWNNSHPTDPLGVKLRIFGGNTAPEWAKVLDGGPMTIGTDSYGLWWTNDYRQAWSAFEHALAARYDSNPLVRAVAVTSCASVTGEPFVIDLTQNAIQIRESYGWNSAEQENCLNGILSDYSGWKNTPIDFPFNMFTTIASNGFPVDDFSVAQDLMIACAQSVSNGGPTCVMGNHGLDDAAGTTTGSSQVYAEFNTLWQASPSTVGVYLQTVGPTGGADCLGMNNAIAHHANSVEIWPQQIAANTLSTLQPWDNALTSQTAMTC